MTSPAAVLATAILTVHAGAGVELKAYVHRARARNAPVVVVVNGGPGLSHHALDSLGGLASKSRTVVFYDQRGTGASTRPPEGSYGLAAQVADLEAVRRALRAPRIAVLGHSFGGLVAAAYASAHPSRVNTLVLADAEPLDPQADASGNGPYAARIQELQGEGKIPDPVPPPRGDDCSPTMNALGPAYFSDPDLAARHPLTGGGGCSASVQSWTTAEVADGARRDALTRLARFRGRTLVIDGADDPFGTNWLDATRTEVAGAKPRLVRLARAGHLPWLEAPRWWSVVRSFLGGR